MSQKVTVPIIYDGDDQIICLPKGFEIDADSVTLARFGNSVIITLEDFEVETLQIDKPDDKK